MTCGRGMKGRTMWVIEDQSYGDELTAKGEQHEILGAAGH